jgi:hypothetical protein
MKIFDETSTRVTRFVELALRAAILNNEVPSALKIFHLLQAYFTLCKSPDGNSFREVILSWTLYARNVHMFDSLHKAASSPTDDQRNCNMNSSVLPAYLIAKCPLDASESIVVRLIRFAGNANADFYLQNTLADLDGDIVIKLVSITCCKTFTNLLALLSRHSRLLNEPVSRGLFKTLQSSLYHSDSAMGRAHDFLQGDSECFDWLARNLNSRFWSEVYDLRMDADLPKRPEPVLFSPNPPWLDVERILRNNTAKEMSLDKFGNIPIFHVSIDQISRFLLDHTATTSFFEIICDRVIATNQETSFENLCLEKLVPFILKKGTIANELHIGMLIEKLKIVVRKFNQSAGVIIQCCSRSVYSDYMANDVQQPYWVGEFVSDCVQKLDIHFVPQCTTSDSPPVTCLVSSEKVLMRLWSRWIHDIRYHQADPSLKSSLFIALRHMIAVPNMTVLRWLVDQDIVRDLWLIDENTGLLKVSLWAQCIASCDRALCQLFEHLPKPQLVRGHPKDFFINQSLLRFSFSFYEYALFTHDLEWIDYVAQWSSPTPGQSFRHLIGYLGKFISNALPGSVRPRTDMSQELIIHLMSQLSNLESPPTAARHTQILSVLKNLEFKDDIEFHQFWMKMWQAIGLLPPS